MVQHRLSTWCQQRRPGRAPDIGEEDDFVRPVHLVGTGATCGTTAQPSPPTHTPTSPTALTPSMPSTENQQTPETSTNALIARAWALIRQITGGLLSDTHLSGDRSAQLELHPQRGYRARSLREESHRGARPGRPPRTGLQGQPPSTPTEGMRCPIRCDNSPMRAWPSGSMT